MAAEDPSRRPLALGAPWVTIKWITFVSIDPLNQQALATTAWPMAGHLRVRATVEQVGRQAAK
jgi:hypothetical protein